jgi:predicted alpha/beta superfamily hydrolase
MSIRNARRTWYLICAMLGTVTSARAADLPKDIVIGETVVIRSEVLNENRTILIGKPGDYDQGDAAYPVLILLDGDDHFHHTTGLANRLARDQLMPGVLVVGVTNTARARDLTPPAVDPRVVEAVPGSGGAASFRSFIADELMPWLDDNYRTHPYKILVGHSLGGLFAVDTLLERPELFDAYIAISPSLQWDEQRLVERAKTAFEDGHPPNVTLFMTAGNEGGPLLGGVRKFAAVLGEKVPQGLDWRFEHMPLESHGSVVLPSTYEGLKFVFADWTIPDPLDTYNRYGVGAIDRFFEKSNEKYRYDRGVNEQVAAPIARQLVDAGRLDEVTELLEHYWDVLKPPARFLERIANGYRERGQADRAIELYELALEVEPDSASARQALTELADAPDRAQ